MKLLSHSLYLVPVMDAKRFEIVTVQVRAVKVFPPKTTVKVRRKRVEVILSFNRRPESISEG